MNSFHLSKPVAFIFFNRPDVTLEVFQAIRNARPPKLFLISDGPRPHVLTDAAKCMASREIVKNVDWPCEVLTHYAEANMGCKKRVSSGLDWVFECVDEAVILEDDCLPRPSFFRYCEELLDNYKNDQRVMMISGCSFDLPSEHIESSYYFVRRAHIWGWATWKRAWNHYDVEMKKWPKFRDSYGIESALAGLNGASYWKGALNKTYSGLIDTWDHQWSLTLMMQRGLSIHPNVNLVTNLGFNQEGTHTTVSTRFSKLKTYDLTFPLKHPNFIISDLKSELRTQKKTMNLTSRIITKLKKAAKLT